MSSSQDQAREFDWSDLDVSTARTPAQAVARWWGPQLVGPSNFGVKVSTTEGPDDVAQIAGNAHEGQRNVVFYRVGAFVTALEKLVGQGLSSADFEAQYQARGIKNSYHAEPILLEAAALAGMDTDRMDMTAFPFNSGTQIQDDESVIAYENNVVLGPIWPPEDPTKQ